MTTDTPLTVDYLKKLKFRGPIRFSDGRKGMAQQDFDAVGMPRFGYSWRRENREDRGRTFFTVDGAEVKDLDEACAKLLLPPDPDSPAEVLKRFLADREDDPMMDRGAQTVRNFAEVNAWAEPFGTTRAWLKRADNAWHGGINTYSDSKKTQGEGWPHWLYTTKHAFHEMGRGMSLFAGERAQDKRLLCAMGEACRECPILREVQKGMEARATAPKFPAEIDQIDIDAAKVATCIGHILTSGKNPTDGAFWWREGDEP